MKRILTFAAFLFMTSMTAQSEVEFLNIFGDKSISLTKELLASKITLCIEDDVSNVDAQKAIQLMDNFLKDKQIIRKKILHNGKSSDKGSSYKVARIKTNVGTYRVFAYSEKDANTSLIKEIRIDKM